MKLAGRSAIITGSGRGIGREIALSFAREGALLLLADRQAEGLSRVAEEARALGGKAQPFVADVSNAADVERMAQAAFSHFGKVDILVNNAAVIGPTAPLHEIGESDWAEVLAVNLTGPFLCARAVLGDMIARRSGRIINIASIAGKIAYPLRSPYAASKWGLIGMTMALAAEVGRYNITVNAICPGPVEGERMARVIEERAHALGISKEEVERRFRQAAALGRMVKAKDVAAVALFLASEDGENITGEAIAVSAGYHIE